LFPNRKETLLRQAWKGLGKGCSNAIVISRLPCNLRQGWFEELLAAKATFYIDCYGDQLSE